MVPLRTWCRSTTTVRKLPHSCLRSGIITVEGFGESDPDRAMSFRLLLAKTYEQMGHPELASEVLKEVLKRHPASTEWGYVAVLRLKHLYQAKQFDMLLQEASEYQYDPRCQKYRPEILLVLWRLQRRRGSLAIADTIAAEFTSSYPDHPLGAVIWFARGIDHIAAREYEEAEVAFQTVEENYPDSRLVSKAKALRSRIKQ